MTGRGKTHCTPYKNLREILVKLSGPSFSKPDKAHPGAVEILIVICLPVK